MRAFGYITKEERCFTVWVATITAPDMARTLVQSGWLPQFRVFNELQHTSLVAGSNDYALCPPSSAPAGAATEAVPPAMLCPPRSGARRFSFPVFFFKLLQFVFFSFPFPFFTRPGRLAKRFKVAAKRASLSGFLRLMCQSYDVSMLFCRGFTRPWHGFSCGPNWVEAPRAKEQAV